MSRTLREYVDNVNMSMIHYGYVENPLPWKYLRTKVNSVRTYIAEHARCYRDIFIRNTAILEPAYTVPTTTLEILDVWFDGSILEHKTDDAMNRYRISDVPSGVPMYWTAYGGRGAESMYIYLYPTPSSVAELQAYLLALPANLVLMDDVCNMPVPTLALVEEGVRLRLLAEMPRQPRDLQALLSRWERDVASATTLTAK